MQIELFCPSCSRGFAAAADTAPHELCEQMFEEGPRFCLGEGATLEDMIYRTLSASGFMLCPDCRQEVVVKEESLGQMALAMLASW